jgi:hypothetical protein
MVTSEFPGDDMEFDPSAYVSDFSLYASRLGVMHRISVIEGRSALRKSLSARGSQRNAASGSCAVYPLSSRNVRCSPL